MAEHSSHNERVALIEWNQQELAVSAQAAFQSLNWSSLYYQPVPSSAEETAFKHRIDQIYTEYQYTYTGNAYRGYAG